jgi:hypothetical protein
MRKFRYGGEPDWNGNPQDPYLNEEKLHACKNLQENKQICLMEKKANQLADCLNFRSYKERLLFIDAFAKGYLAAHCISAEDEELERALSPLGKALE